MFEFNKIIYSVVTEKSSRLQEKGKYTFIVKRGCNKIELKKAVKELYGVDAIKMNTIISPKKIRLVGRGRELEKRAVFKKIIVTLKNKQSIDPHKFKESKSK